MWLNKRVWQLGIAALLVLVATWMMYVAGTGDEQPMLLWAGLILMFVALVIPLLSKAYQSVQEAQGEEGET